MLSVIKEILSESIADRRVRKNLKSDIFQSLLTLVCVFIALLLHQLFGGFIVASLGASSFIIFLTPHTKSSRARCVIGGYLLGAVAGILFSLLHGYIAGLDFYAIDYILILICAASAAMTALLMITTGFVHPPAAALAIGLTVDHDWGKSAPAAILGVIVLCVARRLLKNRIKNLV